MLNLQAGVSEIFSSIQGEGKYVGCRQLFIRLIGCNMDCPYCDTDKLAHSNLVPCVLEKCEGYEGDLELKNPLDLNDIMPYINYRLQQPHHFMSLWYYSNIFQYLHCSSLPFEHFFWRSFM